MSIPREEVDAVVSNLSFLVADCQWRNDKGRLSKDEKARCDAAVRVFNVLCKVMPDEDWTV